MKNKRHCVYVIVFLTILALFVTIIPSQAQTKTFKLTLAGASPGGLWSLLGEGTSSALAKAFPGSSLTYQTSGGGLANIVLVTQGKVEMGIAHNVEVKTALDGQAPFKEPIKDLYALAYMYNWSPHQFILRKDFAEKHGITTVQDIADKKPSMRVGVNRRGNMVEAMNREIFKAYGFTYDDIESWGGEVVYAASREMASLMRDRRIDLMANSVFAPHSSILETANAIPVVMLPLKRSVIESVCAKMGSEPYVIKASTYKWLNQDVPTLAMGAMILVQASMPADDVYAITKALVENIDVIQGVHKSMRALTPELMAGQKTIPYHPGAEKYYKEKGLLK